MPVPTLFSYCLRYDDGAAPNPYWGTLTLAICKPAIRRAAEIGDWVVGTGSRNSEVGDSSGRVIYAMRVDEKLRMARYDRYTSARLRGKVSDLTSRDRRRWLGDSIYDFSHPGPPLQRVGVHEQENVATDLSGEFVLLSHHWYYFGRNAITIPDYLAGILHQTQGHKSRANDPYAAQFVAWINGLGIAANVIYGRPQMNLFADEARTKCAAGRNREAHEDRRLFSDTHSH